MDKYTARDVVRIINSIIFRLFYHHLCLMQGKEGTQRMSSSDIAI